MGQTFKQFLVELMVDVDPNQSAQQQLQQVRKDQLLAKRAPQRVIKQQMNQAKEAGVVARAADPSDHTKAVQILIAKKKEELARLQQRLISLQKTQVKQEPAGF